MDPKWEKILSAIPEACGVYEFKDARGKILYVGKAVNLKSRVRSYFTDSRGNPAKVRRLIERATDVTYIVTKNEFDALVLEANLIKQFKPYYNVLMKDDKSFPYIHLTNEPYPRVVITRRYELKRGEYFGPFTSLQQVRQAVKFVAGLFGVRTCKLEIDGTKFYDRPCIDYHLKLCSAPCTNFVSQDDYRAQCKALSSFFNGKYGDVRKLLEDRMKEASAKLAYESAAHYRDLLKSIDRVIQKTQVLGKPQDELDAIGICAFGEDLMVLVMQVREGKLIGDREFVLKNELGETQRDLLENFLKLYYFHPQNIPREILLPMEPADTQLLEKFLARQKKSGLKLIAPRRGYKSEILALAQKNAEERMRKYKIRGERTAEAGEAERILQEILDLQKPPARIEGYDISNIRGKLATGSMVVFINGKPEPKEYRLFNIKLKETPDDFAMMREVLRRRLVRMMTDEKWRTAPDLVLLDGGKGQLSAVLSVVKELADDPSFSTEQKSPLTDIKFVGLAKADEVLVDAQEAENDSADYRFREIKLDETNPGLSLLVKVRDEAHRFCRKLHLARRQKASYRSVLDEVDGVGPVKRRRLLAKFGSVAKMRDAGVEEIAKVPGIGIALAQKIYAKLLEESFMDIAVEEMKLKRVIRLKRVTPKE